VSRTYYELVILVVLYVLFLKITIALYLAEFPAPDTPVVFTPIDHPNAPPDADVFAEIAKALVDPLLEFEPCNTPKSKNKASPSK
jgi:hypothetical protein